MVGWRQIWTWLFLGTLCCLVVLSVSPPRLWHDSSPSIPAPALEARVAAQLGHDVERHDSAIGPVLESLEGPALGRVEPRVEQQVASDSLSGERPELPWLPPRESKEAISEIMLPANFHLPTAIRDDRHLTWMFEEPSELASPEVEVLAALAMPSTTPAPVAPAGKIGVQQIETSEEEPAPERPDADRPPLPNDVERLPLVVANVPSSTRALPHKDLQTLYYPHTDSDSSDSPSRKNPRTDSSDSPSNKNSRTDQPSSHVDQNSRTASPSSPSHTVATQPVVPKDRAEGVWHEPEVLLEELQTLAKSKPTERWAVEVIRQLQALGAVMSKDAQQSEAILDRIAALNRRAPALAATVAERDRPLARKLKRANFALDRRLDVWRAVAQLSASASIAAAMPETDPRRLAVCVADVDTLMGHSAEGQAWRQYLLVDMLRNSSQKKTASDDRTRQLAQKVLSRIAETPLTPHQRQFMTSGPVAALQTELRRWAAEPVDVAHVLRDLETYEQTGLPSDARRLAVELQSLGVSPSDKRRQLSEQLDVDYRNANVRIAISEELLNKLIPERNLEYSQVNDHVLGRPVRGESLMATEVALRMQPNPSRVRLVLEVTGEIASETTADAGPAQLHNDSESYYIARKPIEIDMNGIHTWPVEVDVDNQTRLTGVETSLDGIPLISSMARVVAKSQSEQNKAAASEEVKQKVAAQASQRVEDEVRQGLNAVVERMNQRVFGPLNSLSLDPQMIDARTTERRTTMRLRLAGEDQLGSHTPRPQAPGDSLASVQIHESALNNAIQRLQLEGRTFTLPELSQHVATRLGHTKAWEINPDCEDVRITFAEKDAIVVRCQAGQIVVNLSIAQLAKAPRKWKNFQVQAFYRPEISGRSAKLVREGPIYLKGRLPFGSQMALRGIFSRALSKNNQWELMPERVVEEPKLGTTSITQFVIDDGWIGVALGPKRTPELNARRPHWGLW